MACENNKELILNVIREVFYKPVTVGESSRTGTNKRFRLRSDKLLQQ